MKVYEVNVLVEDDAGQMQGSGIWERPAFSTATEVFNFVHDLVFAFSRGYRQATGGADGLHPHVEVVSCEVLELDAVQEQQFREQYAHFPRASAIRVQWMRVVVGSPPEYPDGGSVNGTFQGR